jgi:hypothetical protein
MVELCIQKPAILTAIGRRGVDVRVHQGPDASCSDIAEIPDKTKEFTLDY